MTRTFKFSVVITTTTLTPT